MKVIKSFNLTEEQIDKINRLSEKENRSASVIVGMAIDAYYDVVCSMELNSESNKQVPFVLPILHDRDEML